MTPMGLMTAHILIRFGSRDASFAAPGRASP